MNTIMSAEKAKSYLRVQDGNDNCDQDSLVRVIRVSKSDWLSPLGWVFKNGKYRGLQKNSKVVCTKSAWIGYVGWVGEIQENCPEGTITYYFPRYQAGGQPERYTAAVAIAAWGLCVVPDDTDVNTIMSAERARSYI